MGTVAVPGGSRKAIGVALSGSVDSFIHRFSKGAFALAN